MGIIFEDVNDSYRIEYHKIKKISLKILKYLKRSNYLWAVDPAEKMQNKGSTDTYKNCMAAGFSFPRISRLIHFS